MEEIAAVEGGGDEFEHVRVDAFVVPHGEGEGASFEQPTQK